jgi:hypothetical protein
MRDKLDLTAGLLLVIFVLSIFVAVITIIWFYMVTWIALLLTIPIITAFLICCCIFWQLSE